jgi:tetratricopeptide (TPR) repeat protein
MASIRKVELHLEAGDWTSAIRECGALLESILLKIFKLVGPNLSNRAKSTISGWENRKGRSLKKFTLGDLTKAFKDAGVLTQAQNDFGRSLPYLLGADWNTLVPLRNKSTHGGSTATRTDARFFAAYVSTFLEELGWENFDDDPVAASTAIHPFDLFKDFDLLEKVVKPRRYARSDQQDLVSNVLLHSIQPAYYLDKLEVLQDYSRRVGRNPDFNPMSDILVDARTIVENACAVYVGLKRHENRAYFEAVKAKLEMPLTAEIDEQQGSWPEAVRLDFLGLCFYHLYLNARKDGHSVNAAAFLQNAKKAFENALDHFDRLSVQPLLDVAALWKGYALRNLGSVLKESGEPEPAGKSYRQALKERERTYQRLSQDCIPLIASQLLVEVELVKIDIAELEGKSEDLAESTTRLLQIRQDLPAVWPHLEERLYESAIALNAPLVAENVVLTAVEDRLSRLTGKRCAEMIRDEVRSGKIHEVIVSRCHERQLERASDCVPDEEKANP